MCKEHQCHCCSDQFPEDLCACVECYHGDDWERLDYQQTAGTTVNQNSKDKHNVVPAAPTSDTVTGSCNGSELCHDAGIKPTWVSNNEPLDCSKDEKCNTGKNSRTEGNCNSQLGMERASQCEQACQADSCCNQKTGGNVRGFSNSEGLCQAAQTIHPQDEMPDCCENVTYKNKNCSSQDTIQGKGSASNGCTSKANEEVQSAPNKGSCVSKANANRPGCCSTVDECKRRMKVRSRDSCGAQLSGGTPDACQEVTCGKSKCCCDNDEVEFFSINRKGCDLAMGTNKESQSSASLEDSFCSQKSSSDSSPSRSCCSACEETTGGSGDGCNFCPTTDDGSVLACSCCKAENAQSDCTSPLLAPCCQSHIPDEACRSVDNQTSTGGDVVHGFNGDRCTSDPGTNTVRVLLNDTGCEDDDCRNSCEEVIRRSNADSRVSVTDFNGFYPNTPPSSPQNSITVEDSGKKKLLLRQNTTKLRVQNICCAMESKLVQDSLEPLEGVISVAVNVIGRVVYVRHNPEVTSASELVSTLNRNHLGASIMESGAHHHDDASNALPRSLTSFGGYLLIQTLLILIAVVAFFCKTYWAKWVAIAEMVFGICPVLKKAFVSVKTLTVDINILMLIAVAGTVSIQEWLEGAAVVYVFSLAEALQEFCMYKVQRTISGLMLKAPLVAILASSGECVSVEKVSVGTTIAVRPGELIPLDGLVVNGRASVDESSITGESVPIEKTVNSKVFSGTVNQNGYLEVETTSDFSSSTVSKVAQLVQEAQTSSSRTEEWINRFAKYYTPAVVTAAVLVVVFPALLGAAGVGNYLQDIREWGKKALVVLVIACPCALVMSTPIAIVCGITAAARKGALVKGGVHLETLAQMNVLAFDKTGTLTEGKFQVVDSECSFGVHERATLRLAAALESKSSHPLAAAIVNESAGCVAKMIKSQVDCLREVTHFHLHEGQGISGVVDGHDVQIGNYEFLRLVGGTLDEYMEQKYSLWCRESKTVIFVCVNRKFSMMLALADTIRLNCPITLTCLRELGVQTAMITGDNSRTALAVKETLGLDECLAEMKPQDKLSWIKSKQDEQQFLGGEIHDSHTGLCRFWQSCCPRRCCNVFSRKGKPIVGMVGDGVNDGPALAAANVGIAMGAGGTALAVEAADVALMSNNLAKIPELITLGRFCRRIVAENIAFSVVLKLAIVIAALLGKATLWMAVLADVLGLLIVILNGLRPLRWSVSIKQQTKKVHINLRFAKNQRSSYNYESFV